MKKIIYIITFVFILVFFAFEKGKDEIMTIERDCSGTYLRQNGKDYHICNEEKVSSFADGDTIRATYKEIKECYRFKLVCEMKHKNEGWIEIEKIE